MARIVHKAISDMCSLGLNKKSKDMWCSSSTRQGDMLTLDEVLSANGITQTTLAYFLTIFVMVFWEIFLECS